MRIDAGLDTGDILLQREIVIAADDTADSLAPKLADIGAELTIETLRGLKSSEVHPRRQDNALATLAPILKKEDGLVDFSLSATEILNRMRGFQPWPGVYSKFRGKKLQLWRAAALKRPLPPAEVKVEGEHLFLGCGQETALEVIELQLEGKKRSAAADFIRGYRPQPGERLGL
jgi:methionyl-tRNA formyltransferase